MATANAAARGTLSTRPGASRNLLKAKALAAAGNANAAQSGDALEDSFPASATPGKPDGDEIAADTSRADDTPQQILPDDLQAAPPTTADTAPPAPVAPAPAPQPSSAPTWSEADEAIFQSLTARRRAAGFQRRGRDVGGQMLSVGGIAPNAGTVAAAIVALVAERGTIARSDLLAAMAAASFAHPKARGSDRGWSQGYVAGLVRDGFLVAGEPAGSAATDGAGSAAGNSCGEGGQ